jgi:hypothetical protein
MPKHPLGRPDGSPQRGSHPSKNSPRSQPYCITAAVALLLLPSTSHQVRHRDVSFGQRLVPKNVAMTIPKY